MTRFHGRGSLRDGAVRRAVVYTFWLALALAVLPASANAYIYWTNCGCGGVSLPSSMGRAGLNGTGVNEDFLTTGIYPSGVAVDSGHIYWTRGDSDIGRANLDGSGANPSFFAATLPDGVAVNSTNIFWSNGGSTGIGRANINGSGVDNSFISGTEDPQDVVVDGSYIYWVNYSNSSTVGRANLNGTGVNESFITGANFPQGLAVNSSYIYWTNTQGGTIGRANLDGTGVDQSFMDTGGEPSGIAVDGTYIYWTNLFTNDIGRANLDGTGADPTFITGASYPFELAVDSGGAPPTVSISTPANSVFYTPGESVDSSFTCTPGGTALSTCLDQSGHASGTALDTSTTGTHTLTVTATDADKVTGTASVSYTVAAPPTVSVTVPATNGVYAQGESVKPAFTCTDGSTGTGIASCTASGNGAALDTTTAGAHTFTVTALSHDGLSSTATITYTVLGPLQSLAQPLVSGTAIAGRVLSCQPGRWSVNPTGYSYQWNRDGTPLVGAESQTYVVQRLDEGSTLTCTVTATDAFARTATATSSTTFVPVPRVAGCPRATGDLASRTLGLVHLGMTRTQARHAYTHSTNRGRRYEDFFCLTPIGVRVGYASPRLLDTLPAGKRGAFRDRVIWASTSNPIYALDGIRPGATLVAATRRFPHGNQFKVGENIWYIARAGAATAVLKTRGGVVQELGIANGALTKTRRSQLSFITSFS